MTSGYCRMMNRATGEIIQEAAVEESLVPLMQHFKRWFDDIIANDLLIDGVKGCNLGIVAVGVV